MSVSPTFSSFYVGNYNIKMGHVDGKGKGVQRYKLNEMNGEISVASTPQDAGINPTFLCYDDNILFLVLRYYHLIINNNIILNSNMK